MKKVIIICGPTASGKTDFAHKLALEHHQAEIINSDAMQLYSQIPVITASPSINLTTELPYHLYNFLSIEEECSVVKYAKLAAEKIKEISNRDKLPIVVGGTGMYINALLFGYSEIPEISDNIRQSTRKLYNDIGGEKFFEYLKVLDPYAASTLNIMDKQRVIRVYEVFKQTGKSILTFQLQKNIILPEFNFKIVCLFPERNFLYSMCNARLERIFNEGAIEEVQLIKKNFNHITCSAMKAIGVQEIMHYLDGQMALADTIKIAQNKTRQYAKRQITWFKHQLKDQITIEYSDRQEFDKICKANIKFLLDLNG